MQKTDSPILSSVFGCCPRCGGGRLFAGYLEVARSCNACGLDYTGHDAADGPVVPIMLIVGFLSAGSALWFELTFHPSIWLHLIIWPPLILLLSLALLRPFKALFIGAQFKLRAEGGKFPDKNP